MLQGEQTGSPVTAHAARRAVVNAMAALAFGALLVLAVWLPLAGAVMLRYDDSFTEAYARADFLRFLKHPWFAPLIGVFALVLPAYPGYRWFTAARKERAARGVVIAQTVIILMLGMAGFTLSMYLHDSSPGPIRLLSGLQLLAFGAALAAMAAHLQWGRLAGGLAFWLGVPLVLLIEAAIGAQVFGAVRVSTPWLTLAAAQGAAALLWVWALPVSPSPHRPVQEEHNAAGG